MAKLFSMDTELEGLLCQGCELRTAEGSRVLLCARVAREVVQVWWAGSLDANVLDVCSDVRYTDKPPLNEGEWEAVEICVSSHSSGGCGRLVNPPEGNILDRED